MFTQAAAARGQPARTAAGSTAAEAGPWVRRGAVDFEGERDGAVLDGTVRVGSALDRVAVDGGDAGDCDGADPDGIAGPAVDCGAAPQAESKPSRASPSDRTAGRINGKTRIGPLPVGR